MFHTAANLPDDARIGASFPSNTGYPRGQSMHTSNPPQIVNSSPSWTPLEPSLPDAASTRSVKESHKKGRPVNASSDFPVFSAQSLPRCKGHTKIPRPFESMLQFKPSLILENHGSVARDHLALERTFLAYVRTSLAVAGAGVALVQLLTIASLMSERYGVPGVAEDYKLQHFAMPLGMTSVIFALIILTIGVYRYFRIQRTLVEQMFPTARMSIAFISFGLCGIVVVIFGVFLSGQN